MLAAACAVGVAATFAAPIGGNGWYTASVTTVGGGVLKKVKLIDRIKKRISFFPFNFIVNDLTCLQKNKVIGPRDCIGLVQCSKASLY